jgi:hypothetical protein
LRELVFGLPAAYRRSQPEPSLGLKAQSPSKLNVFFSSLQPPDKIIPFSTMHAAEK